jgi:hypothetical protein
VRAQEPSVSPSVVLPGYAPFFTDVRFYKLLILLMQDWKISGYARGFRAIGQSGNASISGNARFCRAMHGRTNIGIFTHFSGNACSIRNHSDTRR